MGRDRVLAIRGPVCDVVRTGTPGRQKCAAPRTTARGDARPPGVVCVEQLKRIFETTTSTARPTKLCLPRLAALSLSEVGRTIKAMN